VRRPARAPVLALALVLAACSAPPDTADTIGPAGSDRPAGDATGPEGVTFHPVLTAVVPCDDPAATPSRQPDACLELGPVGFDGTALARAEVVDGGSSGLEPVVEVEVAEDARAEANALFDACALVAVTCPTGQLAVAVGGEVVSAPTVNEPDLADQPFVIAGGGIGGFTDAEADALAEQLGG
jgi:hypothetical protein